MVGFFLSAQLVQLLANALHIGQHIFLLAGIAQQKGRVINRRHQIIALLKPFAVFLGDAEIGLDQAHGRNAAEANDHLGLQQAHLLAQIPDAGIFLGGQGIAVLRRAAFENVGNIYIFARNIHSGKEFIQQLPRAANKRGARKILLLSGGFAHEQELGRAAARAENAIGSRGRKGTRRAGRAGLFQKLPVHKILPKKTGCIYYSKFCRLTQ